MNFRALVKIISVCIVIFMIILMIKTNFVDKDESAESGLEINDVAPDFQLKNLAGEQVKLSDYRGQKVLLNFWASWCPPCKEEIPHMQKYYEEYGEKSDMVILAVNMTRVEKGGKEKIAEFVEKYEMTFPVLVDDNDGKVMKLYDVRSFPTTYIINSEGVITQKVRMSLDDKKIEEIIN
ncbi:redoxin domain-containing protein [Viridibacillus sp. NPDC093762]|uniref:peroxiredoxin family protein n=1 Tax=Viridibacillus sp. NPDC093762 TaxID=3390720 RepID=UPI003CFD239A